MARPGRYEEGARKLIAEVGLNREIGMSAAEFAQAIDMPPSLVTRVLHLMVRVGTATKRETYHGQGGGKKVFYTFTGDFKETERRLNEQGIPWSAYIEENTPKAAKSKPMTPTPPPADSPFAVLGPLRKSEPRAELEVARKYRDQQAFIEAKRAEFETMGLVFDPAAIRIDFDEPRRHQLDAIVRVLPYVESLEKQNATLEEQNKIARAPIGELGALRGRVKSQTDQIEKLVREKGDIKDDVQRLMGDHRREVESYKEQIANLQGELRTLKGERAVNGAIGRHEANEAIARVGR